MKVLRKLAILFAGAVFLAACANLDTVTNAPKQAGISKTFSEDYELVKAAVLGSMQSLNINIKEPAETPNGYAIAFTKSVSAFSWGEVGRVLVSKNSAGGARVFVHSEKRSKYQITGADESDFADQIFAGVDEILSKE